MRAACTTGASVQLAYVDQSRESLTPDATVYEEITGGVDRLVVGGRELHGRAYVAGFGFKGSDQQKKVGQLSGGERNRVLLAKVLSSGGNVLLLDEPTNDLDVDTLRALEDALLAFPGCAVVISHDRWFLDRIATHVLAFEGESEVRWWEGNFSDYEADRHKRLGVDADQPHRLRYKPLVRGLSRRRRRAGLPTGRSRPRRRWCRAGRRPPTGAARRLPDGTRTMHDDRVPNVSRWTQLAAFGRSSPSGFRWSARMRRKASTTCVAVRRRRASSASRTRSTFGEVSPRARFSSTWKPGGSSTASPSPEPVKSTKNSEVRSPTRSHEPL